MIFAMETIRKMLLSLANKSELSLFVFIVLLVVFDGSDMDYLFSTKENGNAAILAPR